MTNTTYNGWTNYATWRVNLELIDGLDPRDMGWRRLNRSDLADALKEYVEETLESQQAHGTLALDYALAFIADVDWREIADAMIKSYDMANDEEDETEEV